MGRNYGGTEAVPVGATIVWSNAPTSVSSTFLNGNTASRQGVAFGLMLSKVEATKTVASRYDEGDQFTVSVSNPTEMLASATTDASSNAASTGSHALLNSPDGTEATFSETAATAATNLDHYTAVWSCTNNGVTMNEDELKLSADGRSVTTKVRMGDAVDCNVTNTAKLGSVSWTKTDPNGAALAGSEWSITQPNRAPITVVDNGALDVDPRVGSVRVDGLRWGNYTLTETKAPAGFELDAKQIPFTISGDALDTKLSAVVNTPTPTPTGSVTPTPSATPTPTQGALAITGGSLPATGLVAAGLFALILGAGVSTLRARRMGDAG